jgi:hypothetical protein
MRVRGSRTGKPLTRCQICEEVSRLEAHQEDKGDKEEGAEEELQEAGKWYELDVVGGEEIELVFFLWVYL